MHAAQNYIYIIFAVLYIIYSIVKAAKKVTQNRPTIDKQPQQSPAVKPPTASPLPEQTKEIDFKKLLEDLLGGNPEEKNPEPKIPEPSRISEKPQPVKIHAQVPKKEQPSYQSLKHVSEKPKITSDKISLTKHPHAAPKVFTEPVVEEEQEVDFDIRQAVIYSEILKRPEY
ncbi:MAG: hypothetical protein ACHQHP_05190 [Bacteroidia bacterium]